MDLIGELCAEHRRLEEEAALLLQIAAAEIPDPAAVAALRWHMARTLVDHCEREDRWVYDMLLGSGDAEATAAAWLYRQEHGMLAPSFQAYVTAWPVDRIAREWPRFRAETGKQADNLVRRIRLEEQILYAHVARITKRRAAA